MQSILPRLRGRPARTTAPAAALHMHSVVYLKTESVYADGASVFNARIRWRDGLNLSIEEIAAKKAETMVRLAEYEATLSEIEACAAQAKARMEECEDTVRHGAAQLDALKADAVAGRCSLADVAALKVRVDLALELRPAMAQAGRDTAAKQHDAESARARARKEMRDLEAAEAWLTLQAALAPVRGAIATWLKSTGDEALFIKAPDATEDAES